MNPFNLIKLKSLFDRFRSNHPKLMLFFRAAIGEIQEGSIVEIKVTSPEGKPLVTNLKINPEDMELISELKGLK